MLAHQEMKKENIIWAFKETEHYILPIFSYELQKKLWPVISIETGFLAFALIYFIMMLRQEIQIKILFLDANGLL